jgi:hypothetical protein
VFEEPQLPTRFQNTTHLRQKITRLGH